MATLPADDDAGLPTLILADRLSGVIDLEVEAEGRAEVRRLGQTVTADSLKYWAADDEVEASGNVRLTRDQDIVTGPKLRLRIAENVGFMETPVYTIRRQPKPGEARGATTGYGRAERVDFEGSDNYRLSGATFTTCAPDREDWYAQAAELELDFAREVGVGRDAKVMFKGVPVLYSPWMEFSLNDRRKSGFLTPTIGASSRTGTEVTVPYYWNIAPNRDATISPRLMTRRGLMLGGEFRYLDPNYSGIAQGEVLPNDTVLGQSRHQYAISHTQNLGGGFAGSVNLNGVSDPLYFTDLSSRIATTSQQLLLRQGVLTYGGPWWTAQLMAQSFQTLQDPLLPPISEPYERLPQISVSANRPDIGGFAFLFNGEFVDFHHPTQVLGQRLTAYPQIAYPIQTASFFLTPKVGVHASQYSLSRQAAGTPASPSRSIPVLSVDAGLIMERDSDLLGQGTLQTLEPRLFYVYVPYHDQSQIPVFDSGQADLNFAQIFSENIFVGNDRFADANQITAAVSSRFIDGDSGEELLRAALGQRYYMSSQRVTLPGVAARSNDSSDILAAISGRVLPKLHLETAVQYNTYDQNMTRIVAAGRYRPGPARVMNASYRFQRGVLDEVDFSAQWPLQGNWYGVGRYNYSLRDDRLVETLGGLEYNGGCWVGRAVLHRFAAATQTANTSIFLQLEFNGLTKIGSNPLDVLKRSIPGYGNINRPVADPVFGD